jgi:hypothetical protein
MLNLISPAYAVICNKALDPTCATTADPYAQTNNLIQLVFGLLLVFLVIFFFYHFLMATYRYISSEGDPKKVEQARDDLLHTFVGVLVAFSVFALVKLIGVIFGIPGLQNLTITWPTL